MVPVVALRVLHCNLGRPLPIIHLLGIAKSTPSACLSALALHCKLRRVAVIALRALHCALGMFAVITCRSRLRG